MLREIIVKIDNSRIYFNQSQSIPTTNSNLPIDYMKFKYHKDIFWRIELVQYIEDKKCWQVKVKDYGIDDTSTFIKQTSTRPIESLEFDKLDWQELEPQLSFYQAIKLVNILYNHNIKTISKTESHNHRMDVSFNKSSYEIPVETELPKIIPEIPRYSIPEGPIIENYNVDFSVKFQEATFINGAVIFKKFIKKVGTHIDFKIVNSCILAEFDTIKGWFSKKLKTKKFNVSGIITLIDKTVTHVSVSSPEIEMINYDIIESIKYDRTIALTKPPKTHNPDKSIYTSEDIFQLIDPEVREGNVFNQTDIEIIKSLSGADYVRNRKQLEYLSEIKQTANSKIHYTLNPLFGFLFLNETKAKYYFVWELLNSHATYTWSINKNLIDDSSLYAKIEKTINVIRAVGREEYKRRYSDGNDEFTFKSIDHKDITANVDDGFNKWKSKLDDLLD